ncbi:hypothetical protein V6N13_099746 [Hibiscus sabdariffa]
MATAPSPVTSISLPKSKFNEKFSRTEPLNPPQNPLSLLPQCTSLKELKQIQAFAIKTHLQNDHTFLTKLINFCTKNPTFTSMEYAHKLFDNISQPDVVLFNTMARGYSRSNTPIQAIPLFSQLLSFGFLPDDYTFPSVLKACSSAKALEEVSMQQSVGSALDSGVLCEDASLVLQQPVNGTVMCEDVATGGDIAPISVKGGGFLEGTEAIFVDSVEGVVANSDSSGVVLSPNRFEALCNAVVEHEPIASPRKNRVVAAGVEYKPIASPKKDRVAAAGIELENIQKLLLSNPSGELIAREKEVAGELKVLSIAEEKFFRQKSRVQYINEGDENTAFFFGKVKLQQKANSVCSVYSRQGAKLDTFEAISNEFIQFFIDPLGTTNDHVVQFSDDLLKQILRVELSAEMQDSLVAPITHKEIKDVLFSMNGNKASGVGVSPKTNHEMIVIIRFVYQF